MILSIDREIQLARIPLLDDAIQNGTIEKVIAHRQEKRLFHLPCRAKNGNAVLFLPVRIWNRMQTHRRRDQRAQRGHEIVAIGADHDM